MQVNSLGAWVYSGPLFYEQIWTPFHSSMSGRLEIMLKLSESCKNILSTKFDKKKLAKTRQYLIQYKSEIIGYDQIFDWDLWRSPVIEAYVRSNLVDTLRQETQALTGGACILTLTWGWGHKIGITTSVPSISSSWKGNIEKSAACNFGSHRKAVVFIKFSEKWHDFFKFH